MSSRKMIRSPLPPATTGGYHRRDWYHGWYTALVAWAVLLLVATFPKGKGERDLKSLFLCAKCRGFLSPALAQANQRQNKVARALGRCLATEGGAS